MAPGVCSSHNYSSHNPVLNLVYAVHACACVRQEVEQTVFDQQLQPWMQQRGYHSLFHPRRSPAGVPEPDEGVTLHFRTSAFTHVDSVGVLFAAADASSALPPACCSRHRQNRFLKALRQREEGCLLALLRHEPSQQQLLVVSTHLFWNPVRLDHWQLKTVETNSSTLTTQRRACIQHAGAE